MASDKPQLKTYIEPEYYYKFKSLAEEQNRSVSNYLELLVKNEVKQYEREHGIVQLQGRK